MQVYIFYYSISSIFHWLHSYAIISAGSLPNLWTPAVLTKGLQYVYQTSLDVIQKITIYQSSR